MRKSFLNTAGLALAASLYAGGEDHAANFPGHAPRMTAMDDPEIVVDAIVKACTHPKEEMPVGPKRVRPISLISYSPDLTERISGTLAKKESEKAINADHTTGTLFEPMVEGRDVNGGIRRRMKQEDAS